MNLNLHNPVLVRDSVFFIFLPFVMFSTSGDVAQLSYIYYLLDFFFLIFCVGGNVSVYANDKGI